MALTNWEVGVYALYLLGGATRTVHTEDVALKCFELAPDCFSWIKHREYPDKDIGRLALTDARKDKVGGLVFGRAGKGKGHAKDSGGQRSSDGWQLSEAGIAWIKANEDRLVTEFGQRQPKAHRQEILRNLARVRNHPLYKNFIDQPNGFVPRLGDLAELLRCRVDAEAIVWDKRLKSLRNQALDVRSQDIVDFVDACDRFVRPRTDRVES